MDVNGLQTALARQARPLKPLNPLALPREDFERVEICRTSPSEGSVHQIDRAQVGDVEDCERALCRPLDSLPTSQARAARQSRFTVITETASASATSPSLRPPKKRSSTTRAARGSAFSNLARTSECKEIFAARDWIPAVNG